MKNTHCEFKCCNSIFHATEYLSVLSVSTPDGASELLEDVNSRLQQRCNSSLVQGTPVYGPRSLQRSMDKTRLLCSIIDIFEQLTTVVCSYVHSVSKLRLRYICNFHICNFPQHINWKLHWLSGQYTSEVKVVAYSNRQTFLLTEINVNGSCVLYLSGQQRQCLLQPRHQLWMTEVPGHQNTIWLITR